MKNLFLISSLSLYSIIAVGGGNESYFIPLFIKECGGANSKIVIISAAKESAESQRNSITSYTKELNALGVYNIVSKIILNKEDSSDGSYIDGCNGIIITGGNQQNLIDRIYKTSIHYAIDKAYKGGATIFSNSAGTACLGQWMITRSDPTNQEVIIEPGFNIIEDIILDQHYSQRNREWRLKIAVNNKNVPGVGIDEETAIFIKNNKITSIGKGKVYFVGIPK